MTNYVLSAIFKIVAVLLAYILIEPLAELLVDYYYVVCSCAYAIIGIVSGYMSIITKSKLLISYSAVSLLTSVVHFIIQFAAYEYISYPLWYAPINLSLIAEIIELMLVFSGVLGIVIYFFNSSIANTYKRKGACYRMVKAK